MAHTPRSVTRHLLAACGLSIALVAAVSAQTPASKAPPPPQAPAAPSNVTLPTDYVIGPEDVVGIVFWREPDMSGDMTVRPDGRITVPVIGEVDAAGLHPQALQKRILEAAGKYITDPNVAVVVRQINSRKIFITGQVTTPGPYPLTGPRTVMQAIALAGGLTEYADTKNITILRVSDGRSESFKFNYKEVARGRSLEQNILLKPGDTVVVP